MKTLVAYRTRYGSTADCAGKIKKNLQGEVDVVDLKSRKKIDLDPYDAVILGGSIYAGRIQSSLLRFCEKQKKRLIKKRIGLYICCLYENEKAVQELEENYPEWLKARAVAREWFGGRAILSRMSVIDRFLFTRIAGVDTDVLNINDEKITRFCRTMDQVPENPTV